MEDKSVLLLAVAAAVVPAFGPALLSTTYTTKASISKRKQKQRKVIKRGPNALDFYWHINGVVQ